MTKNPSDMEVVVMDNETKNLLTLLAMFVLDENGDIVSRPCDELLEEGASRARHLVGARILDMGWTTEVVHLKDPMEIMREWGIQ